MNLSRIWMAVTLGVLSSSFSSYAQSTYEPYYFTLLVGGVGSQGGNDGTGAAARFSTPEGAAVDNSGNIYIADTGNYTIRKITPGGVVTTLAGVAGSSGSTDGTGGGARFNLPQGIALDGAGNIYVGDSGNLTIRKIAPDGVVTTLAGLAGQGGSVDGPGNISRFGYPIGVSVDTAGNVYVADDGNDTIRMITPAGVVSTIAGLAGSPGNTDGVGSAARFNIPTGVACDTATGAIYVADTGNNTVRRITLPGTVTTVAGLPANAGTSDGTGSAARFDAPRGVTVDGASNVYVASENSHTIRKIRPGAIVTTLAGSPGIPGSADGLGTSARFNFPYAVAADFGGHLYVADTINQTVRLGRPGGEVLSLTITELSNGHKLLSGHAFPNVMVDITATTSLSTPFLPFVTAQADSTGFFQYDDTAPIKRFYRASVSGG